MDKKIFVLVILVICIALVIGYLVIEIAMSGNNVAKFNKKVSKLQEALLNDNNIDFSQNSFKVFISVSDSESKAYVVNATGSTLKEAISNAKSEIKALIKKYNIDPEWVKIDVANSEEEVDIDSLNKEISVAGENNYRNGIAIDSDYKVALLESEINANSIIDYENNQIDLDNLNTYITSKNKINIESKVSNLPENVTVFSTVGYIYDDSGCYKISTEEDTYGRRETDLLDEIGILELIENGSEYLIDSIDENGKFIYRYNTLLDSEATSYNILRHEGTIWSMIESYKLTKNSELKDKIELGIKYVVNTAVKYKDENTAYIIDEDNENEIKLGANGIGILMFIEYMETFNSNEYDELLEKLAEGILQMQNEDGSYYHVYSYPGFEEKEEFRTVYYDGEATYALAKLYGYTKDEIWLEKAEKALDYFCENNYEKYRDHWLEYSVNEVTKYSPKQEYFDLGLKNVRDNLSHIVKANYDEPIDLELLTTGIEIYDRAISNGYTIIDNFNVSDVVDAVYYRSDIQLNGLFYPEVAMYFNDPSRILGAFFVRSDKFRIRIDDVQHNINGYYNMYNIYNLLGKYSD